MDPIHGGPARRLHSRLRADAEVKAFFKRMREQFVTSLSRAWRWQVILQFPEAILCEGKRTANHLQRFPPCGDLFPSFSPFLSKDPPGGQPAVPPHGHGVVPSQLSSTVFQQCAYRWHAVLGKSQQSARFGQLAHSTDEWGASARSAASWNSSRATTRYLNQVRGTEENAALAIRGARELWEEFVVWKRYHRAGEVAMLGPVSDIRRPLQLGSIFHLGLLTSQCLIAFG